jgi:hypothetical protein
LEFRVGSDDVHTKQGKRENGEREKGKTGKGKMGKRGNGEREKGKRRETAMAPEIVADGTAMSSAEC